MSGSQTNPSSSQPQGGVPQVWNTSLHLSATESTLTLHLPSTPSFSWSRRGFTLSQPFCAPSTIPWDISTPEPQPSKLTVELTTITKSDGILLWVAYCEPQLCWVIKVGKEALSFRGEEDLGKINEPLKTPALLLLRTIQGMGAKRAEQFKTEMAQLTLVGELTGLQGRSSVVKYPRAEIFFYGMVLNNKAGPSVPPYSFLEFCDTYQLDYANYRTTERIESEDQFQKLASETSEKIRSARLQDQEQGAYLFVILTKGKLQKMHSIYLVENKEYLVYSAVKDSILSIDNNQIDDKIRLNSLRSSIEKITGNSSKLLPQNLNFYLNVADYGVECARKFLYPFEQVKVDFASILLGLLDGLINGRDYSNELFSAENANLLAKKGIKFSNRDLILKKLDNSDPPKNLVTPDQTSAPVKRVEVIQPKPDPKVQSEGKVQAVVESKPRPVHFGKPRYTIELPANHDFMIILPVSLPGMGIRSYYKTLSKLVAKMNVQEPALSVEVQHIDWTEISQQATSKLASQQHKLSIEAYTNQLSQTSWEWLQDRLLSALQPSKPESPSAETGRRRRQLILVHKHFTLQSATCLLRYVNESVAASHSSSVQFLCLSNNPSQPEPALTGSGPAAERLPFNSFTVLQCAARKGATTAALETVLGACRLLRGTTVGVAVAKEAGFAGFIGFPFVNVERQEEYTQQSEYAQVRQVLSTLVFDEDSTADPTRGDKLQLIVAKLPRLLHGGAEWWQVAEESAGEGITHFDAFVAKSLSTIYKKLQLAGQSAAVAPSKEELQRKALVAQIPLTVVPSALEALQFVKNYDPAEQKDSAALRNAVAGNPSTWRLLPDPKLLLADGPTPQAEVQVVAFAYIPSCGVVALPQQTAKSGSFLHFAEAVAAPLSSEQLLSLAARLYSEAALSLDRSGPVEELTALRVDGRLVYIVSASCKLSLN